MSKADLQPAPHHLDHDAWWYETPKGVCVVVARKNEQTKIAEISWRAIRGALKRLEKKP